MPLKEADGPGKWKLRYVNAYCPRLFSAIRMPDTVLATRTIIIPLIRTADRNKANFDPMDYSLWPHDRKALQDELWAIGLANLPVLHDYENQVAQIARLRGRNLQPWKAILSIATWLDDIDQNHRLMRSFTQEKDQVVIGGLGRRLEEMSWRYQQEETGELQSSDLTLLVLQAMYKLASAKSDIKDKSDIATSTWTFSTSQISEAAQAVAENTEADVDKESITSRKVGRLLGKLRLRKTREAGKGTRQWQITLTELERWTKVYGIHLPTELVQKYTVTNVTDGLTSQDDTPPWLNCEIALRLPANSKLPTIGGFWRQLPDGRLEAGYSSEELALALTLFLDKDVDAEKFVRTSAQQLKKRLVEVTGGEVLHIQLKETVKEKRNE